MKSTYVTSHTVKLLREGLTYPSIFCAQSTNISQREQISSTGVGNIDYCVMDVGISIQQVN